ncbi:hypothetical protein EJ03DRAFT_187568 [Teratosphaeria nubilosa]|uniref:Uncharacterized protein n=1 Tax=Teratosphaeria nubilosa TaxID=161662 RepID=A0A6G1LI50_9PEZI|nr:hypothetical protein EJ03DRAFT_187568 [Teratosphaeria nubilosa]
MIDGLHSIPGFTSEASLSSSHQPRTPPDTPHQPQADLPQHQFNTNNKRRRFSRSDSPVSSIHPTETSSPAKKAAKRTAVAAEDNVQVQELLEGDAGYQTDLDVIYPEELEEVESSDQGDDELSCGTDEDGEGGHSDTTTGLSRRLSRMNCGDPNATIKFEQGRRARRMSKRMGGRVVKRSHSESLKGEGSPDPMSADINTDAMNDHDRVDAQRRLRRRTRGPQVEAVVLEDMFRSSPEPSGYVSARSRVTGSTEPLTPEPEVRWKGKGREVEMDGSGDEATRAGPATEVDAMDVDTAG